jgi:hypothetical protein
MVKKFLMLGMIIMLGLGIFGIIGGYVYAENTPVSMTNLVFAGQLAQKLNINVPTGTTGDAYFQALANALAARGINNFVGLDPNGSVSYGEMVEVMYNVAGGQGATTADQKLSFLTNNGYDMFNVGDFNAPVSDNFAQSVFSSNTFNELVAEAYSAPEGVDSGQGLVGADAPGAALESPSSAI